MAASSCSPFGTICLLGIISNSLVICIVLKKSGASSSVPDIFIISLSMVDLLFLLGMPCLMHQLLGNRAWHFVHIVSPVITALDANSQFSSTYILTAMSINHYPATVYPFISTRFRKCSVAILVICVLWALSFLSITPVCMYAQLIPLPGGLLGCRILLPDPHRNIYWCTLYQFFLVFVIPFTLITAAYRRILLKIARSSEVLTSQKCIMVQTKKSDPHSNCYLHSLFHLLGTFPHPATGPARHDSPHSTFLLCLQYGYQPGLCQQLSEPLHLHHTGLKFPEAAWGSFKARSCRADFSTWEEKHSGDTTESGQPLLHLVSVSGC